MMHHNPIIPILTYPQSTVLHCVWQIEKWYKLKVLYYIVAHAHKA